MNGFFDIEQLNEIKEALERAESKIPHIIEFESLSGIDVFFVFVLSVQDDRNWIESDDGDSF